MQERTESRSYAFYRVIILLGIGTVLVASGDNLLQGIGAGMMALGVIMHVSTVGMWEREEVAQAIREITVEKKT